MAFPYLTISSNISDLNTGSFYAQNDLSATNATQSVDVFFGQSEKDVIEFSVFDISGNIISSSNITNSPTYNVLNKSYKDVDGKALSYSYSQYKSSYTINSNRFILADTLGDLADLGIPSGSNVISYNFIRNVAGEQKYPLIIKDISTDRREIQLVPTFKLNLGDPSNVLLNLYYESFCRKQLLIKDIITPLNSQLKSFRVTDAYNSASLTTPSAPALIKSVFGFKVDAEIIEFLNDLYTGFSNQVIVNNSAISSVPSTGSFTSTVQYTGIQTYINDWLYTYYKNIVGIDDLKTQFRYILNTAISKELSVFNYNYKNLDQNGIITTFVNAIFFDNFLSPLLDSINTTYQDKYYSYLKNALNFGGTKYFTILNHGYVKDVNGNVVLVVKLFDYLPSDVNMRDTCWVSNISNVPIIQKVIVNATVIKPRYKIAGPNFKANVNQNQKSKSINETNQSDLINSALSNQIQFNKNLQEINVDYSDFNNFIVFSSAQLRTQLFQNKLNQLLSLSSSLVSVNSTALNAGITQGAFVSASYQYDVDNITSQMQTIYGSFDGYESYLYNNQSVVSGSAYNDYLSSAIQYDQYNRDSLVNNTPDYINVDDNNSDYMVFLSMIGHFFDNLNIYIGNFPISQYVKNTTSSSYANSLVNLMLQNLGWDPIDSTESTSISSYFLNNLQNPNSDSGQLSQSDKMKMVWSRILNNLPYLYKTKGTPECIDALANIYGIPQNLVNVAEFGSNTLSDDDQTTYTFDQRYYFTKFSGSNEYVTLPINNKFTSLEFKFNFNKNKTYNYNDKIFLANNSNLSVYVVKDLDQYSGKMFFALNGKTINTTSLPFFNGSYFSILVQTVPQVATSYDVPNFYSINVVSADQDRVIFQSSNQMLLSSSYQGYFISQSINFGNSTGGNNNFYGTLDKINIWNAQLNSAAFLDHSKNFNGFNDYNISGTYQDLYFRYSVDYPIDLSTTASFVNGNSYYNNLTASCHNFLPNTSSIYNTCLTQSVSAYPYQYAIVDILQNISYTNFGPNVFRQPKINIVSQSAVARLMPNESSTTNIDVSNNSNLVGVYISPYASRNSDIVNFLGDYDIMNIIGDPSYVYSSSYNGLQNIRDSYNVNNVGEKVLYQEFMTLYKGYFDTSFFNTVSKLIPARSKLFTGVLVQPSILERNKYQNKPIQSSNIQVLQFIPSKSLYTVSSAFMPYFTSTASAHTSPTFVKSYDAVKTSYISNDRVNKRFSVLSQNGIYTRASDSEGYALYYIYKNVAPSYSFNRVISSSSLQTITGSSVFYNFSESSSLYPTTPLDTDPYPVGHYSLQRNATSRKTIVDKYTSYPGFFTTNKNTVNSSGSLDGSSPITMTSVNNTATTTKLVAI